MKIRFLLLVALLFVVFTACETEEDPTILQVVVLDQEGEIVPNAVVQVNCQSSFDPPRPCEVEHTGIANREGFYEREFQKPLVVRLNAFKIARDTQVLGVLPDTTVVITSDSLCGETFVSIQENETTRKSIVVGECN